MVSDGDAQPVTDPVQIAKAAHALSQLLEKEWDGEKALWATLLRALCRLAETAPADNNKGWLPTSITNAVDDLGEKSWKNLGDVSAKSRINNHWRKLGTNLAIRKNNIITRGPQFGLLFEPRSEVIGEDGKPDPKGGRGKKARYCLLFFPMPTEKSAPSSKGTTPQSGVSESPSILSSAVSVPHGAASEQQGDSSPLVPENYIQYYPIPLTTFRLMRLPADGLSMAGWVGRLLLVSMTGSGLAFFLLSVLIFLLVLYASSVLDFLRNLIVSGLLLIMLRVAFGWWLNLIQNSVARAPFWWQPFTFGDNVIERRLDPNGTAPASLHLVRYVADCPLCGAQRQGLSAVRLDSGRIEFYGRIVGRCRHAPNEHVWSFDHITGRGRFLR